jgi:peptidoglycan/xylan/chitin deacetylase (PgdA/CDA1 family)
MTSPGPTRTPFSERGGRLRGLLDLATGRYPGFLFGLSTGRQLPVFHLHEVTPSGLEPRLRYLAENGYRTVTSDAIARLVRGGAHPGPRSVALCFDDAWASLWTTAAPLLRRYGFQAIAFAIPARITDAVALRPTLDHGATPTDDDRSAVPFVTWPELERLRASGTIDVQSHSWSHSMIFSAGVPLGFVGPSFVDEPLLNRPRRTEPAAPGGPPGDRPAFLTPADLGAPLYRRRSRLGDGWRFHEDVTARERCIAHVRANGGPAFFAREGWRAELLAVHGAAGGRFETPADRDRAILEELDRGRSELAARLGTDAVRHLCAPWGISGQLARRAARRVGYDTMFADRLFGRRTVRAGDDPYSLMRLHERFIGCLPGRGRRHFLTAA